MVKVTKEMRELIERIRAQRSDLADDDQLMMFALENTLDIIQSQGITSCDVDRLMARMEQLETRLLESELMNRKLCAKLGV